MLMLILTAWTCTEAGRTSTLGEMPHELIRILRDNNDSNKSAIQNSLSMCVRPRALQKELFFRLAIISWKLREQYNTHD